jgi:hypothetical protein
VFMTPSDRVAKLYSQESDSLLVAFYDSQGCCGNILRDMCLSACGRSARPPSGSSTLPRRTRPNPPPHGDVTAMALRWLRLYIKRLSSNKVAVDIDCFAHCTNNKTFREELIAYFSLIRHGPHRKRRVQQFHYRCMCIRCRSTFLPSRCLAAVGGFTYTQTDERDL